jgi:hypothetical protein
VITTDRELQEAVANANSLIQAIHDYVGRDERRDARLRFPRGYLRTNIEARRLLPFVRKSTLKNNLAYSIMLAEVYAWILRRTDLAGIAQEMVVKAFLALAGAIAEAVLVDHYEGVMGKRQKYTSRTERLVKDGIIRDEDKVELDWLWEARCRQHLYEINHSEFNAYSDADFPRASAAVNSLVRAFTAHHRRQQANGAT